MRGGIYTSQHKKKKKIDVVVNIPNITRAIMLMKILHRLYLDMKDLGHQV